LGSASYSTVNNGLKQANFTISVLIFLVNLYFLPFSFVVLKNSGGAMGYSFLLLPISVSINLFIISSALVFKLTN